MSATRPAACPNRLVDVHRADLLPPVGMADAIVPKSLPTAAALAALEARSTCTWQALVEAVT